MLLPFSREPGRVPFLLEAQRGCYIWHSTHHDAVTIQPLYENGTSCSQRAVLVAESTQPIRLSSIILAREVEGQMWVGEIAPWVKALVTKPDDRSVISATQVTDHELRCDVKVDVIDNIEIVSRTRELYVDDAPLELMVRALDSKGNTFSTLAGMVFEWSIAQDSGSSREELSSKIRILKYSEAEYSPPNYIIEMEKEERQGDVILVSGIRTGAAVVKVRIYEPFYKKVAAALIRLLVLENIFLIPSHDTYLLVGAYIKYRVAKMVQGRMTEVKFPLEHYTLELQDHRLSSDGLHSGMVALLDEKTAMVTAVQLGQTNLVFVHKMLIFLYLILAQIISLSKNEDVHMRSVSGLPNSTIYVVEPGFLPWMFWNSLCGRGWPRCTEITCLCLLSAGAKGLHGQAPFRCFTIHPGGRWSLEVGQVYVITVEVFDKSSTRVYISDNLKITSQLSNEYFEEQLSTSNGSYHVVKALRDGVVVITATLTSSRQESNNSQEKTYQISHQQEVEGGSGNFTWSSSNETVAMVTTKGVVTAGQMRGNSTILARDVQNPFRSGDIKGVSGIEFKSPGKCRYPWNRLAGSIIRSEILVACDAERRRTCDGVRVEVYVLKLNKMELLPFQADVEIGQIIEVPIAMYHVNAETKEAIAFTDCSHLPLDLNSDKQGVFTLLKEEVDMEIGVPGAWGRNLGSGVDNLSCGCIDDGPGIQQPGAMHCSSVHLAATSPGHTLVTVSVTGLEEHVWSSATFAAYEPLKALNPVAVALVAWQAVKEMVFEGGPRPWVLEPSRFFLELSMEKAEAIRVTEVRLPAKRKQNQYVYRVLCLELGEQVLTLRIGNHPGVLNPSPSVEKVQVRFVCAHPASMLVTPVYKVPAGTQPCPLPQYNKQLIPVSSLRSSVLELAVFDQHGRKFDNFSSLMLEWKSSNKTLAHFEDSKSVEMVARDDGSGQTRLHGHQILEVHQIKGTVLIGVNFAGYSGKKSPKGISNLPRSAAVELLLVEDVTVQPENATIYNHPDVKEIFNLVEGSGYFLINSSEQDIVTITYMEAESWVQLVPARPGFLTLKVYDLCLAYLGPAMAQVRVSDIQEVELDLIDKVEIGKTVLVAVRVLGSSKHPFRNKYFRNMDVRLQLASAIVTLRLMEDQDEYSENYMLRAVTVGQTTLVAIATDSTGRKLTSAPRHVEQFPDVFPPFRLVPEKMTLIATNMMQTKIMSEGGPQPQSIIHFSISNQTVAVVNRRGQVTGKAVGTAVVHGTIQTVNEDTGKVIVFSQDEVQIEVVQLQAVRILAAATRLVTATEMPVYVMGVTSTQTPFSFSNANPMLTFHWSMSKRDVLDLVPRHSEVFLQLPAENNFAMVVHTKAAGRTTIKVTVSSRNSSFGQFEGGLLELSDEIQILVFEKLQLFYADCQPEQILMPMNSQLKLHTNREGVAPVTYLRLSSYPKLYTAHGRALSAFPLGMSLTFIVEFYNSIGEKFHTHNTRLYMALNRDDLLLIGPGNRNYTYMAQAVNKGVTVVGLWDQRHPGMADYIPVAVEHAIEPDTKLTLLEMSSASALSSSISTGEPGVWMISTNNIVQTDTVTGVGVARSPGTATIFHDIPGVVKTFREVVVNASSRLTFSYDLKTYLTNTPNATAFKLFISTGRNVNLKGSCTPSQALAVENVLLPETLMLCHVQFSNTLLDIPASKVFHIHSEFSMEKGVYVCLIKVRQESEELRQVLSVADTSVYGWATLVSERGKNGMQRILIPFIPGFYMNQSEFILGHKDTGELRILGVERVLESLEVFHSSPFLAVSGYKHSTFTTGLTIYLVRIVNFTAFQQMSSPAFINVSCALTNQQEAVVVRAKDVSGADHCEDSGVFKNFVGSYQILLFTLFAVLASTAFIFLAYNAFLNKVQTIPVVYVPTLGTTQPGPYTATCSPPPPPHFLSSQPPLVQSRLQHWLWSIKH
ncbi:Nuclear pore membrane glycoprotein 210-like [Apodemus speciosus]|uniref:Nuclear pore membrane glycoprotein 210-like n=1 Tax=Apodemus speciosus TaxID=105296 RepID=A0ABQ0ELU1_APOSI